MNLVMEIDGWGIFENTSLEIKKISFKYSVLTPRQMKMYNHYGAIVPLIVAWKCNDITDALEMIKLHTH